MRANEYALPTSELINVSVKLLYTIRLLFIKLTDNLNGFILIVYSVVINITAALTVENVFVGIQLMFLMLVFVQIDEDELFNPDYVEVDRVLDETKSGDDCAHYLVKWRSLPYDECTWELSTDIDNDKIQAFLRVNEPPPESERKVCTVNFIV